MERLRRIFGLGDERSAVKPEKAEHDPLKEKRAALRQEVLKRLEKLSIALQEAGVQPPAKGSRDVVVGGYAPHHYCFSDVAFDKLPKHIRQVLPEPLEQIDVRIELALERYSAFSYTVSSPAESLYAVDIGLSPGSAAEIVTAQGTTKIPIFSELKEWKDVSDEDFKTAKEQVLQQLEELENLVQGLISN